MGLRGGGRRFINRYVFLLVCDLILWLNFFV